MPISLASHRFGTKVRVCEYKFYSFFSNAGYSQNFISVVTIVPSVINLEPCKLSSICKYCHAPGSAANFFNSEKVSWFISPEQANAVEDEANRGIILASIELTQSIIRSLRDFGFRLLKALRLEFVKISFTSDIVLFASFKDSFASFNLAVISGLFIISRTCAMLVLICSVWAV